MSSSPFLVIHDFMAQDERSPYGQAVEHIFENELAQDFFLANIRDNLSHARLWAGGSDGQMYQLLTGLNDHGTEFTSDLVSLLYVGPYRTGIPFIEWYGDKNVQWYVSKNLDRHLDLSEFVSLTDAEPEVVPGDDGNPHYRVALPEPEMIHAYLWLRLPSHSADAPANGMKLTSPPHMPLSDEMYGRIWMIAPLVGTSRGK